MDSQEPFYLTTSEVAKLLRCSPESVRRWCARKQLACVRRHVTPGGPARYLIPRAAVLAKLEGVTAPGLEAPSLVPLDPRTEEALRRRGML